MEIFIKFAFLFCIGCSCGWGLEVIYRRFFSKNNPTRGWINPGFLVGPWLPLYGFGLCLLYLLASLEPLLPFTGWLEKLILFLVIAIGMTAVELIAGLISVKLLKVHLWDYAGEWGNLWGLICPKFSFYWSVLGALYYFLIHPHILDGLDWLSGHLSFSLLIGVYLGVFCVDVVRSCKLLTLLRRFAKENQLVLKYDRLLRIIEESAEKHIGSTPAPLQAGRRFFRSLYRDLPLSEHFKSYLAWVKEQVDSAKDALGKQK